MHMMFQLQRRRSGPPHVDAPPRGGGGVACCTVGRVLGVVVVATCVGGFSMYSFYESKQPARFKQQGGLVSLSGEDVHRFQVHSDLTLTPEALQRYFVPFNVPHAFSTRCGGSADCFVTSVEALVGHAGARHGNAAYLQHMEVFSCDAAFSPRHHGRARSSPDAVERLATACQGVARGSWLGQWSRSSPLVHNYPVEASLNVSGLKALVVALTYHNPFECCDYDPPTDSSGVAISYARRPRIYTAGSYSSVVADVALPQGDFRAEHLSF